MKKYHIKNRILSFLGLVPIAEHIALLSAYNRQLQDTSDIIAGKAEVYDLCVRDGHINAEVGHQMVRVIAASFTKMFDATPDAKNFMQMEFTDRETGREYVMTLQRKEGKTPGLLLAETKQELLNARLALDAAEKFISGFEDQEGVTELLQRIRVITQQGEQ